MGLFATFGSQVQEKKYGRSEWTRTINLFRVNLALLGFTTTYKYAGTAKVRVSHTIPRDNVGWVVGL
jgi:hypothetical protein